MLAERLYRLRKLRGLSQKELAARLMVTHYTVSSYEKGRSEPNDEIKVRIAKEFGVSLDYLLGLIDDPLSYDRAGDAIQVPPQVTEEERKLLQRFILYLGLFPGAEDPSASQEDIFSAVNSLPPPYNL